MTEILFIMVQLLFASLFLFLCIAFATGAPFVPSNKGASEAMIRLAKIKKGTRIVDLGSGDGRLLILAAKQGALAQGFEINPYLVLLTRVRALFGHYKGSMKVSWGNLWKASISDADVVFVYLLPWRMEELAAKLKSELRSGTLVISNSFIFPDWKIHESDTKAHIYAFKLPMGKRKN
ncbi:MAG: SAM-dependent methyltransferase [Patescibacteria group bacterium]